VFALRGFHGASLEQIAEAANFSTGAIYWHFKSKDDLFLAVFEDFATTRLAELAEIGARTTGTLGQRARAYADHWMERQREDPAFTVLALEFLAYAWRRPELRTAIGERRAAVPHALGSVLEVESKREGVELPMPAQDLARILRELGVGLGLAKLADPEGIADGLFGDFVELFFELVCARPPRPA